MSQQVISSSIIPCQFQIPPADNGESVLLNTVQMTYTSAGVFRSTLNRATNASACDGDSFTIEGDNISLCPQACDRIGADPQAELKTLFGCTLEIK